jgi:cell division protein FtsB
MGMIGNNPFMKGTVMKERLYVIAAAAFIFVVGTLIGAVGIHTQIRISSVEANQAGMVQNMSEFAKQVNAEFAKVREEKSGKSK